MAARSFPRTYTALKLYGFSPAKALEIILDAKRGKDYARDWVRLAASRFRRRGR